MNFSLTPCPLLETTAVSERLKQWSEEHARGEVSKIDVYGKPTEKQLQDLQKIRDLSKELQDNLHELETSVRIAEVENQAMMPTAPILDYSEDHEFIDENEVKNVYSIEDTIEAKEEEKLRLMKGKNITEIQQFYKDQCVFVTGGTGFLGKVIIEKLLRSCSGVDTIYVLIRSKKGKDPQTRIIELMDEFIYGRVHEENPKAIYKVVPIVGDLELPGLGISAEDRKTITTRVSIIINSAATVKFDEKLPKATVINVHGTKEVLKLAKECRHLKAITHVSTAYSNPHLKQVDERFYEPPITIEALDSVMDIDEHLLDGVTPKILGDYPNTYCFTKAVAEEVVRKYGEGLPICVVRPSIVLSTYEEPVRGWSDTLYGPSGMLVGVGTGILRTMYLDTDKIVDFVPVDMTVNSILVSVWHTAKNYKENQTSDIPIYNFVSGAQNPLTWGRFMELNQKYGIDKPTTKAVWYYGFTPTKNYYLFLLLNFFFHYVPAALVDGYCSVTGKKKIMLKLYHKLMRLAQILFYFTLKEWQFSDGGVRRMWGALSKQDQCVFPFNMADMSWEYHAETYLIGLRTYLVKEDISTLPEARKRWNRLFYLHQFVKLATFGLLINLVYLLLKPVFNVIY